MGINQLVSARIGVMGKGPQIAQQGKRYCLDQNTWGWIDRATSQASHPEPPAHLPLDCGKTTQPSIRKGEI
jgi:hypothetical protein